MKTTYVQKIIDYIEDHIEDPLCHDDIATYIGYSKFYLSKVFSIYTGMSIMQYIKKRKLEYSLLELNTDKAIVDIAFQYGFNSRRAFSRLFTTYYGYSPSYYRHKRNNLPLKIIIENIGGIKMLPYLSESKVVNVNTLYALAQRVISNNPEDEVIKKQTEYKLNNKLNVIHELGYDVPIESSDEEKGYRGYECLLCLSKEDFDAHTSDVVRKIVIPASKYIMLTIDNPFKAPFERIPNGWKKLVSDLEKGYEGNNMENACGIEEVLTSLSDTVMNIYIPIK